ncbi:MAG: hypothetical protein QGE95_14225 [Arenicellales bacterium]|nr:hypothetical protein [Arenicellales bacterium]
MVDLFGRWMENYGPCYPSKVSEALAMNPECVDRIMQDLVEAGRLVDGELMEGAGYQVCERQNYETMLRMNRRRGGARRRNLPSRIPSAFYCAAPRAYWRSAR